MMDETINLKSLIYAGGVEPASQENKCVLGEGIRSKYGNRYLGSKGKRFSIREFESLVSIEDITDYAYERLKVVGSGSSRVAFILSQKYVLKVARDSDGVGPDNTDRGTSQNRAEWNVWKTATPLAKSVLPKVLKAEEFSYYWIISELCRPIKSEEDFKEVSGFDFEELLDFLHHMKYQFPDDNNSFIYANKTIRSISELIKVSNLSSDEMGSLDQWGKTADGRLVLLDSGGTHDVLETYYTVVDSGWDS